MLQKYILVSQPVAVAALMMRLVWREVIIWIGETYLVVNPSWPKPARRGPYTTNVLAYIRAKNRNIIIFFFTNNI